MPEQPPAIKVGDRVRVSLSEDRDQIAGKWGDVLAVYQRTENRGEWVVTIRVDRSNYWWAVLVANIDEICSE